MEVKLNVYGRVAILGLLPKEGNYATLRLLRDLQGKVGLSADELKEFDVKTGDGSTSWNEKGLEERPIEFKDREFDLISEALQKLDKAGKLGEMHMAIYEKFVLNR